MSNAERFKLTERGLYWLKIDIANTFGKDKLLHDEQVSWVDENIEDMLLYEQKYIQVADSPFEFRKTVDNYRMYLEDKPVNDFMYVDCSNQALQCYALLTGSLATAEVCNMAGKEYRADGYQMLADALNKHFSEPIITRAEAKKPMMVTLYGKQRAWESMLPLLEKELKDTDVYSDEFSVFMDHTFNEAMFDIAPEAMEAMDIIQSLNDGDIGTYYWTLPDGFKVTYDVKTKTRLDARRITKGGVNIHFLGEVEEYKSSKYNAGMAPNVIHSVDGYILRETIRRFPEQMTSIHDAYGCHYNFIDDMIAIFKTICNEILKSDLLNKIMREIADGRTFRQIEKSKTLTRFHINKSRYAIS